MADTVDGELVSLRLVPVEVFGAGCATHCESETSEHCVPAYGLMDAVQAWSDCNRAEGRVYRVDDTSRPEHRRPGDTVEVFVRRADLPWFEKQFSADRFSTAAERPAGPNSADVTTP